MGRLRIPGAATSVLMIVAFTALLLVGRTQAEGNSSDLGIPDEDQYEQLKAARCLPQPERITEPGGRPPAPVMPPDSSGRFGHFLIPLDDTFEMFGRGMTESSSEAAPEPVLGDMPERIDKCGTQDALEAFKRGEPRVRPTGLNDTLSRSHFIIHYTTAGPNAVTRAYAEKVARYAENSWSVEIDNMEWRQPPADGGAGGDNRYDIYILDINYAGEAVAEISDPAQEAAQSYIKIHKGLADNTLKVTVAHEFNHASQYAYTWKDTDWWAENTAVWMEEQVYDSVNDYRRYLNDDPSSLTRPEKAITCGEGDYWYSGCLWPMFLHQHHDVLAVRRAWERMGANPGEHTLEDLNWTLGNHYNSTLTKAVETYAVWRYFTKERADRFHFTEAANFPVAALVLRSHGTYPAEGNQGTRKPSAPGGVNFVEYTGGSGYLHVRFDGQDQKLWAADLVGYRNPAASVVDSIPLADRESIRVGCACMDWSANSKIVLVATATQWNPTAANLTHGYQALSSFSPVPFSGGAAPLYRNDDLSTGPIALQFQFSFYGTEYDHVYINNNGNLSFTEPYWQYTPVDFPTTGYAMIAPFWADVDTRNTAPIPSGVAYYKSEPHQFTVIWDRVGYYDGHSDKRNAFEVILTDGTVPLVGRGNNVAFCYCDMEWTTGDGSGGAGGLGGTAATVGANKGDGTTCYRIGTFNEGSADPPGPGDDPGGIDYLDGRRWTFDLSGATAVEGSVWATLTQSGTVLLNWSAPSLAGIDELRVYRATEMDGAYALVSEMPIAPHSPGEFEDVSVWPETTFWYELRAVLSTGVEEVVGPMPASVTTGGQLALELYPVRPNPTRGRTTARFDVPDHAGPVRLAVYNVRGQLVRLLENTSLARGRHHAHWDGTNEHGRSTSAGVYFLRLEVDGQARAQKVLIVR